MNKIIAISIVVLLLPIINSLRIDLSPASLNLEGNTSEKICGNFSVTSDRDGTILILDKWTENGKSRNIKEYNLSGEEFEIEKDFPDKIFISANKKENIEICFSGRKSGNFYGAVLFESEEGFASVGTWINLNITEKNNFLSFTGNVINNVENKNMILGGICLLIIEGVVLLFLIKYRDNKKQ